MFPLPKFRQMYLFRNSPKDFGYLQTLTGNSPTSPDWFLCSLGRHLTFLYSPFKIFIGLLLYLFHPFCIQNIMPISANQECSDNQFKGDIPNKLRVNKLRDTDVIGSLI